LLQKKEVDKASNISKKLKYFYSSVKINFKNIKNLNKIKKEILKYGIKLEYLEIRNKYNLSKKINKSNFKLFIAYYINEVRLIDNF
jgi:pantoate--beta-alanine ligase